MALGGVPRRQKMLKGHLPRVIYHQVYYCTRIWYTKSNFVYKYTSIRGVTAHLAEGWVERAMKAGTGTRRRGSRSGSMKSSLPRRSAGTCGSCSPRCGSTWCVLLRSRWCVLIRSRTHRRRRRGEVPPPPASRRESQLLRYLIKPRSLIKY